MISPRKVHILLKFFDGMVLFLEPAVDQWGSRLVSLQMYKSKTSDQFPQLRGKVVVFGLCNY